MCIGMISFVSLVIVMFSFLLMSATNSHHVLYYVYILESALSIMDIIVMIMCLVVFTFPDTFTLGTHRTSRPL